MTRYENEGYRPRESLDATLSHDDRSTLWEDQPVTGEDLHRVRPPAATAAEDQTVTIGETTAEDKTANKRNRKRITKAIKLLTSAVATVTIAATISSGGTLGDWADDFFGTDHHYSQIYSLFDSIGEGNQGFSFSEHSPNSYFIQAFGGDQGFRIESKDENVRLMCHEAYSWDSDSGRRNGIYIIVSDESERYASSVIEFCNMTPERVDDGEIVGTLEVEETGEILHYRAMQLNYEGELKHSPEEFAALIERLFTKLRFCAVDNESWNRVQLGETMLSTTHDGWYGIGTGGGRDYAGWSFCDLVRGKSVNIDALTRLTDRTIHDIHWTFYTEDREDEYDDRLWLKPDQEDLFFSLRTSDIRWTIGDDLENIVDYVCETGLDNIYLLADRDSLSFSEWFPNGGEFIDDPVLPPVDPVIPSSPGDLYVRDYPQFEAGPVKLSLRTSHQSKNSGWVQFALDSYRFHVEGTDPGVHMMLDSVIGPSTGAYHDVYENSFRLLVDDTSSDFMMVLYCALDSKNLYTDGEMEQVGQLSLASPGVTLYYSAQAIMYDNAYRETEEVFKTKADELVKKLNFTAASDNNWNRMLIGETMYSDMTSSWAGFSSGDNNYMRFRWMSNLSAHDLSTYKLISTTTVNDIPWLFYYDGNYSNLNDAKIWCVPMQEQIAIGVNCIPIMTQEYDLVTDGLTAATLETSYMEQTVDYLVENALNNFHLLPGAEIYEETITYQPNLADYPRVLPLSDGLSYSLDPVSKISDFVQFGFNGNTYRLKTRDNRYHLLVSALAGAHKGDEYWTYENHFNVIVQDNLSGFRMEISFSPAIDRILAGGAGTLQGQFSTYDGEKLYYSTHSYIVNTENTKRVEEILSKLEFVRPDATDWSRIQIGNITWARSDVDWSASSFSSGNSPHLIFDQMSFSLEGHNWADYQFVGTRIINSVPWHFYYQGSDAIHDAKLWCLPGHQEYLLGISCGHLMTCDLGMEIADFNAVSSDQLMQTADYISENALSYFYLLAGVSPRFPDPPYAPELEPEPEPIELALYPQVMPDYEGNKNSILNPISENSDFVQVSVGESTYRIEAQDPDLHIMIAHAMGPVSGATQTGDENSFTLAFTDISDSFAGAIRFAQGAEIPEYAPAVYESGSLTVPTTGETLYYYTGLSAESAVTEVEFRQRIQTVLASLQFVQPNLYGDYWNKVQIGETICSSTDNYWAGLSSGQYNYMQFDMLWTLDRLRSSGIDLRYVTTQTVDRIVWHFYYVPGETLHDLMLWCVPAHEEIALGMYCGRFMTEFSGIDAGTIGVDYLDFSPEELENLADDVARIILYRLDPMPDVDTLTDVTLVPPIMEQYAQILPNYESSYEYKVQPLSSTGRSAQFILDGKTYRIESADESVFLAVSMVQGNCPDSFYGGNSVMLNMLDLSTSYKNSFLLRLTEGDISVSGGYGTLVDPLSGTTFYYSLQDYTYGFSDSASKTYAAELLGKLRFTEPVEDGWNKLQIGNTMYMETYADWRGFGDVNFAGGDTPEGPQFESVARTNMLYAEYNRFIRRCTINGIDWDVTYDDTGGVCYLILIPTQEPDIALRMYCRELLLAQGYSFESDTGTEVPDDQLQLLADQLETSILRSIYLLNP